MNSNRSMRIVRLAVLALVTACMGATVAGAQTTEGKFNLPFAVRWGQAVLPPGNYTFTVNSSSGFPANSVVLRGEDLKGETIASTAHEDSLSGKNELTVERHGEGGIVRTLRVASAGLILHFTPPKGATRILAQAPVLTQRLPVLIASK